MMSFIAGTAGCWLWHLLAGTEKACRVTGSDVRRRDASDSWNANRIYFSIVPDIAMSSTNNSDGSCQCGRDTARGPASVHCYWADIGGGSRTGQASTGGSTDPSGQSKTRVLC